MTATTTRRARPSRSKATKAASAAAAADTATEVVVDDLGIIAPDADIAADLAVDEADAAVIHGITLPALITTPSIDEETPLTAAECAALDPDNAYEGDDQEDDEEDKTPPKAATCPTCHQSIRTARVKATDCTECGKTNAVRIIRGLCPTCYARDRRGAPAGAAVRGKLTEDDVTAIRRERLFEGSTLSALATKYGVSAPYISTLCSGKTWAHVPFPTA